MGSPQTPWTPALRALWARLLEHPFTDPARPLDFTARLAREQGLSRDAAESLVDEYRRFCFLCCAEGEPMTPSAEVDEAWHLHLTCTRDYWQRFCPAVLGTELHHDPTGGTRAEGALYRERYARTLAAYTRWFGSPPERWWPSTRERFAHPARWRRIDTTRVWLLRRPRWGWRRLLPAAFALLLPFAAYALSGGPLDWTGDDFLALFAGLCVALVLVTQIMRHAMRGGDGRSTPQPDVWQLALLAGGPDRVTDAAVAELNRRECVAWDAASGRLTATGYANDLESPLAEVHRVVAAEGNPATVTRRARGLFEAQSRGLERLGLYLDAAARRRIAWATTLPVLVLLAFGGAKIMVGLARDRPVGFLVALCVLVAIYGTFMLFAPPRRTRVADRCLAEQRRRHAHAMRAPRAQDVALAVALAGTVVLADSALAGWHQQRAGAGSSGGDSGSSSDSSSSGDGDGDGGGSGCGGCGGGGGD
jgi:uncharacterized protein (TIGR04222 family)